MADYGEVAIICDFKHINHKQGDDSPKALGITALITDSYGTQTPILLEYIPCETSTDVFTVPLLAQTLNKFGLLQAFKESKISFSCDGGMQSTINHLFRDYDLEPLVTSCQVCPFFKVCFYETKINLIM